MWWRLRISDEDYNPHQNGRRLETYDDHTIRTAWVSLDEKPVTSARDVRPTSSAKPGREATR